MCALVTGVQTCALPISAAVGAAEGEGGCDEPGGDQSRDQGLMQRFEALPFKGRVGWGWDSSTAGADPGRRSGLRPRHPATRPSHCRESRRSEEHTSELQSLMRNSYAVFCLKKKKKI